MISIKLLVLGVVQGITEFFPISSSGHLVLLQDIFGMDASRISLAVFSHAGTLLSVVVVFKDKIIKLIKGFFSSVGILKEKNGYEKLVWLVVIANIPAGIVGIFFKDNIEQAFNNPSWVYVFLLITGVVLLLNLLKKETHISMESITISTALLIGIAQMFAILPGISRSGITITIGVLLGMMREDSAAFSFMIMLPAVSGATLLELMDFNLMLFNPIAVIFAVAISFISGYIALKMLININKSYKLHYFAFYCFMVGLIGFFIR